MGGVLLVSVLLYTVKLTIFCSPLGTGYTGVICGECADGYGLSPQGHCTACTEEAIPAIGIALIAVFGTIFLTGMVVFVLRRLSRKERHFHERASELFGQMKPEF